MNRRHFIKHSTGWIAGIIGAVFGLSRRSKNELDEDYLLNDTSSSIWFISWPDGKLRMSLYDTPMSETATKLAKTKGLDGKWHQMVIVDGELV